jgi:hypothetical protein
MVKKLHVAQHHDSAEQKGCGVCHVLAGDVWGRPMNLCVGESSISSWETEPAALTPGCNPVVERVLSKDKVLGSSLVSLKERKEQVALV